MLLKRNCPTCNKEIFYKTIKGFENANINNSKCKSCEAKGRKLNFVKKEKEFFRKCPVCNKEIGYSSERNLNYAIENNIKCRSCSGKIAQNKPEQKKKLSEASSGDKNPMFNKHFTKIWKDKYGAEEADRKIKEIYNLHSENMKNENNPMFNKNIMNVWIEKYGEETANKKYDEWKINVARHGEKNGMYGKPSPVGSGNGWSGWYKGIYFRSILELSYLKYLFDNDIKFESGEKANYKIQYQLDGKIKNYFPDFYLIDTEEIIEIKPKALINSYINCKKFESSKKTYGDKFRVITEEDIVKLTDEEIYNLYMNKKIKFIDRYDKMYKLKLERKL